MKKLLGIVVLGLLWCNVGFAETKVLECLWWDNYYDGKGKWHSIENKWKLKIDDTNMYIYDYPMGSWYPNPYPIILEQESHIIAEHILYDTMITTINYNKKTGYTMVMTSDVVSGGSGVNIGNCK